MVRGRTSARIRARQGRLVLVLLAATVGIAGVAPGCGEDEVTTTTPTAVTGPTGPAEEGGQEE